MTILRSTGHDGARCLSPERQKLLVYLFPTRPYFPNRFGGPKKFRGGGRTRGARIVNHLHVADPALSRLSNDC
jgi:hypothetical protein